MLPYVPRMYLYVTSMLPVCTRMHSYVIGVYPYVVVCYSYVLVWCFSHDRKGTLKCNSSSSVLVLDRTSPSLLHTFVVDTLLNFPLPFNIPVILTYTNTSRVNAFRTSSCS